MTTGFNLMARPNNQYIGLWHSRFKLAASSFVCFIFILLLEYRAVTILPIDSDKKRINSFQDDFDYAEETMEYMYHSQIGAAYIRPVVEKESPVIEHYWFCETAPPTVVRESGWIDNDGIYVYSATRDTRPNSLFPKNQIIQVLSMTFRSFENRTTVYCNIFTGRGTYVVEGYIREIWQRAWDPRDHFYVPNLISCPIPTRLNKWKNFSISLSLNQCEGKTEAIQVRYNSPVEKKAAVAVCVKGVDFQEDISTRLIEWIEAQLLMGVDRIAMYTYTISEKMQKVLDHYGAMEKLQQIRLTLPGGSPNIPIVRSSYIIRNRQQKRRHELIPYNDCLYRHLYSHRYVLILDTDELIVPLKETNYEEFINQLESTVTPTRISSLSIRNIFKFPMKAGSSNSSFPEYMYMLQNNQRSKRTSEKGAYGKSFTSTSNVATVFNHFALHRLNANVSATIYVDEEVAVKLHYKSSCPIESKNECEELEKDTVVDHSLDRYDTELQKRVTETMKILKFV